LPLITRAFSEDWIPAVRAFNKRLADGGSASRFPEHPLTPWLPKISGREVFQDLYLATEGEHVRGGFILKRQEFSIRRQKHRIAHLKLPISEGIVNKAYASVGLYVIRSALQEEPRLFCLGMGGFDMPLARMVKQLRWSMLEVPFLYDVNHPARFLRNIQVIRTGALRSLVLDLAAASGTGWLGVRGLQAAQKLKRGGAGRGAERGVTGETLVHEFGDWTDKLWNHSTELNSLIAVRDRSVLNLLYPSADPRFLRMKWKRRGENIGWSVLLDTTFEKHRQFGAMRVGSLVDGLALPANIPAVVKGSAQYLRQRGVDILVSNQAHPGWHDALIQAGFTAGPSNFILALSPALAEMLAPIEQTRSTFHINRGDGDGPINL